MKNRKLCRQLHRTWNENGAAMIVVVCVLMVVMILCLTIIVGAYQTMSSVNDGLRDVSDYQQAKSFSDVIKKKIVCTDAAVPASVTDLLSFIYIFASDFDDFVDDESENGPTTELLSDYKEGFGNLRILLNKKKVSANQCTLFVNVMVEDGNGNIMTSVRSGYDVSVTEATDFEGNITQNISVIFRAYY